MDTTTHRHTTTLLFALSALAALQPLSLDMYMPAIPRIADEFDTSAGAVQLTMSIAMFGNALGMVIVGPLSDRVGRRAPALACLALYTACSIGCAISADVGALIAMRFFQAFAVVGGVITARSIISDLFEPRDMARYMSTMSLVVGVAPIVAPLIGGVILVQFGWRTVFWVLAACGVLTALVALRTLPETRLPEARAHARTESPLQSYWLLFSNPRLFRLALSGGLATAVFLTYLASGANLIISQFGVPPALFGFYFGANAFGMIIAHQINRVLLKHYEPGTILHWSLRATLLLGILLLALAIVDAGKWPILAALFLLVACFPFNVVNVTALAQGEDRARGGSVASLVGAATAFLGAAGATLSSVLYNGTPVPMAATMTALAAAAILAAPRLRISAPPAVG